MGAHQVDHRPGPAHQSLTVARKDVREGSLVREHAAAAGGLERSDGRTEGTMDRGQGNAAAGDGAGGVRRLASWREPWNGSCVGRQHEVWGGRAWRCRVPWTPVVLQPRT